MGGHTEVVCKRHSVRSVHSPKYKKEVRALVTGPVTNVLEEEPLSRWHRSLFFSGTSTGRGHDNDTTFVGRPTQSARYDVRSEGLIVTIENLRCHLLHRHQIMGVPDQRTLEEWSVELPSEKTSTNFEFRSLWFSSECRSQRNRLETSKTSKLNLVQTLVMYTLKNFRREGMWFLKTLSLNKFGVGSTRKKWGSPYTLLGQTRTRQVHETKPRPGGRFRSE